jgi:hypothetical protein
MQRHPQPDARLGRAGSVIPDQHFRQMGREPGDQPALRHCRGDKDEGAVPAVFGHALGPVDAGHRERLPECSVHRVAHGQLIGVGPGWIAEVFHINDQDGAVDGWLKHPTCLTSCMYGCGNASR